VFSNPLTGKYNQSLPVADNATASEFSKAVSVYYSVHGTEINVIREDLDVNMAVTAVPADVVHFKYTVTLQKLINGLTTDGVLISKDGSTAQVTFELPDAVQKSLPPLSGKFRIKCVTAGTQSLP
jgi:hypothetical protein